MAHVLVFLLQYRPRSKRAIVTAANHDFNRYLFDAIIHYQLTRVGDIVNWAKTKLLLNSSPAKYARDNVRMYVLLGDPTAGVSFIGNGNSKRLHQADCRWVDWMSAASKVFFSAIEKATQLSYKRCSYCLTGKSSRYMLQGGVDSLLAISELIQALAEGKELPQ